ncbi:MAG TPA: STM3941 family protein [Planctomycetota bacterium]
MSRPEKVCYESFVKTACYVFLGLLMVGASLFCTRIDRLDAIIAGWFGVAFFGACELVGIARLFVNSPRLTISDSGISDIRDGFGLIEWSDILSVDVAEIQRQKFIALTVEDPEKYVQRLSTFKRWAAKANTALVGTPIIINTHGLDITLEDALTEIRMHLLESNSSAVSTP